MKRAADSLGSPSARAMCALASVAAAAHAVPGHSRPTPRRPGRSDAPARGRRPRRRRSRPGTANMTAQNVHVGVPQRRLGPVDQRPGRQRVRRGQDHRPVDALQQMHARSPTSGPAAAPGEQPRASSRSPCASRTSASRCRLCASPAGASMSRCRSTASAQLAFGALEVTHQQGRLADQRRGEGDATQGTDSGRRAAAGPRLLDDLVVGDRAVEEVLGDAQVRVEESRGEPLLRRASAAARSGTARTTRPLVRDQPLQGDEVHELHGSSGECRSDSRAPVGDLPRRRRCRR